MSEPYFPSHLSQSARDAYDLVNGEWSPARSIGARESSLLVLARCGLISVRANPRANEFQFRMLDR